MVGSGKADQVGDGGSGVRALGLLRDGNRAEQASQGWRRDSLKPGDQVIVEGYLAKDGSHTMSARSVVTPDGKKLFAGSPTDGGPQDQKSK